MVRRVCVCAGMNFVAGFLLGWMDEERSFWTLCNLVEDLLPAYFSKGTITHNTHDTHDTRHTRRNECAPHTLEK